MTNVTAPWRDDRADRMAGAGSPLVNSLLVQLERLSTSIETWVETEPGQADLIQRNVRALAANHPTLRRTFRIGT